MTTVRGELSRCISAQSPILTRKRKTGGRYLNFPVTGGEKSASARVQKCSLHKKTRGGELVREELTVINARGGHYKSVVIGRETEDFGNALEKLRGQGEKDNLGIMATQGETPVMRRSR